MKNLAQKITLMKNAPHFDSTSLKDVQVQFFKKNAVMSSNISLDLKYILILQTDITNLELKVKIQILHIYSTNHALKGSEEL